mgnify:CR=1 FL=1
MAESMGMNTDVFTPDHLIAGTADQIVTESVTLLSGENRSRGTLLGKVTKSCPATGAAGTNTGGGTCTGVTMGKSAKIGTYALTCIAKVEGAGSFQVIAPDGARLKDATVGVAYMSDHLNFTLNDGAPDFEVGDSFTIAVAAGSGKYKMSLAAAVDGSQDPAAILAGDTNATDEDRTTVAYKAGQFSEKAVTFGTGHTAASVKDVLADKGIHIKTTIAG